MPERFYELTKICNALILIVNFTKWNNVKDPLFIRVSCLMDVGVDQVSSISRKQIEVTFKEMIRQAI